MGVRVRVPPSAPGLPGVSRLAVLVVPCLLALLVPTSAFAGQAPAAPSDPTCDYADAAGRERAARRRLGATRSAASPIDSERLDANRTRGGERPVALEEVSRWLGERIASGVDPEGSYALFYAHRGGGLASWLIGREGLLACTTHRISPRGLSDEVWTMMGSLEITERQIPRAARPTRAGAVRPPPPAEDLVTLDRATETLSAALFPADLAPHLRRVRHLVVIPTGEIGTLPFYALRPFGDRTQAVDHFSISIAPSLPALALPVQRWSSRAAFARPLIVGDPALPPSDVWNVPRLDGARAEAREIGRMLRTAPLVGENASKARVLAAAPGASLLFIATHGISDDLEPITGGFLMLAGDRLEDGWWTAREIQSSRLTAQLAVLSACQTGLGAAHAGGTIGLTRAFQLAGVPRVVMSLWNIDDSATRGLMTRFMNHAADHRPAEALRLAMLETRRQHPHPAMWASFLLFGEGA